MARVVRFALDVFAVGLDHHVGLYFENFSTGLGKWYVPIPHPPHAWLSTMSLHAVGAPTNYWGLDDKKVVSVIADGDPIVTKGHAAKYVVHLPPGINLLVPVTIVFSTMTWNLAVASVIANKQPVASTHFWIAGFTTNCGDPISLPSAAYQSHGTVHVTPSAGDWATYGWEAVKTGLFELGVSWGVGKMLGGFKNLVGKALIGAKVAGRDAAEAAARKGAEVVVRENALHIMNDLIRREGRQAAKEVGRELVEQQAREAGNRAAKKAGEEFAKDGLEKSAQKGAKSATQEWAKPLSETKDSYFRPLMPGESKEAADQASDIAKKEAAELYKKRAQHGFLDLIDGSGDYFKKKAGDAREGYGKPSDGGAK